MPSRGPDFNEESHHVCLIRYCVAYHPVSTHVSCNMQIARYTQHTSHQQAASLFSSISSFVQRWLRSAAMLLGMLSAATLSRCYWRRGYRRRYTADIRLTYGGAISIRQRCYWRRLVAMLSASFRTFRSWSSGMWPPSRQ